MDLGDDLQSSYAKDSSETSSEAYVHPSQLRGEQPPRNPPLLLPRTKPNPTSGTEGSGRAPSEPPKLRAQPEAQPSQPPGAKTPGPPLAPIQNSSQTPPASECVEPKWNEVGGCRTNRTPSSGQSGGQPLRARKPSQSRYKDGGKEDVVPPTKLGTVQGKN